MKLKLTFLLITLSLSIKAQDFIQSNFQNVFVSNLAVGDFDGDGAEDFFGIDIFFNSLNDIYWFKNEGVGAISFEEILIAEGQDAQGRPNAIDYDRDGDLDIIVAKGENLEIVLLSNDGNANFEEIPLGIEGTKDLQIMDLEGDGDFDIIGMDINSGNLFVYIQGIEGYTTQPLISGDFNLKSFALGDLNKDGNGDLVIGFDTFFGEQIMVYTNQGDNNFSKITLIEDDFRNLGQVSIEDINKDGQVDILAVMEESLTAWISDGAMNFEKQDLITYQGSDAFGFVSFSTADYNGDGQLDFVIGEGNTGILWFKNVGSTPLAYEQGNVGGVRPVFDFLHADFDLDGDPDILLSNGDLWWYENQVEQLISAIIPIEQTKLKVFPNPFTDYLQIQGLDYTNYQFTIIDLLGKTLWSQKIKATTIIPPNLPAGRYQIHLQHLTTGDIISTTAIKIE